jgi:DNA-directed RNA polymerase subunit M/transcription elongation factor TFIIS|tara:strand:+ start:1547 stop:1909 length:363 start_codon:yes stop_codon:yes gene_type:complete
MDVNFCENCDNILYLYKQSDGDELYYCCKSCSNQVKIEDKMKQVYTNTNDTVDISESINSNPYITHDITIPTIQNNSNIKCQNVDCPGEETSIKFIKYDDVNMKYIYICNHCGHKWKNSL